MPGATTSTLLPAHETQRDLPPRPAPSARSIAVAVVLAGLFAAAVWSTAALHINIASIVDSVDNATRFVSRMFPLDFPPLGELISLTLETLAIVVLATALAVLLSLPVALFAAWNTTTGRFGQTAARVIIVLARAVPDLVLAIVFFRVFGLGALPGILAMGLHSVGMIGKLFADAIEELDNGPQEAIRAAGGNRVQGVVAGILPPLLPQIVATALHRFDINLRTSVLLGYVGVGGIGLAIADALRALNYQRGMALAFTVLALCIVTELVSGAIRTALLRGGRSSRTRPTWSDRLTRRIAGVHTGSSTAGSSAAGSSAAGSSTFGSAPTGGPGTDGTRAASSVETGMRLSPPWDADRIRRVLWCAVVAVILALSVLGSQLSLENAIRGIGQLPETLALFFPPATGGIMPELWAQLLVTVQIALSATLLGTLVAIPIGVFAARNVVANRGVHTLFRVIIVVVRGIPELIVAIIFVVITGLGGVAGTLALALGAVGLLSKLVADSLEETDTRVQEALRANGASPVQVFFGATVRQVAPAIVAHVMYLLDTNIRSATLLGIVGAGGIGFLLLNASRVVQFDVVTTIVVLILGVVLVVEALAMWLRAALR